MKGTEVFKIAVNEPRRAIVEETSVNPRGLIDLAIDLAGPASGESPLGQATGVAGLSDGRVIVTVRGAWHHLSAPPCRSHSTARHPRWLASSPGSC